MFWVKYWDQVDEVWEEELVIIRHLDKCCSVQSRERTHRDEGGWEGVEGWQERTLEQWSLRTL